MASISSASSSSSSMVPTPSRTPVTLSVSSTTNTTVTTSNGVGGVDNLWNTFNASAIRYPTAAIAPFMNANLFMNTTQFNFPQSTQLQQQHHHSHLPLNINDLKNVCFTL